MTSKDTDVKITIKSEISSNGENTNVDTVAEGRLFLKNGKYYIIYEEPDMLQMGKCTTTVKYDTECGTVFVKHSGSINTKIDLELNCPKRCLYDIKFGTIVMETCARVIECNLTEDGGRLHFEYDLDMGGEKSYNKFEMTVERIQLAN